MRQFRILAALVLAVIMVLGDTYGAITTDYIPGQTTATIVVTCDDRPDSQLVNIALENGVVMTFSIGKDMGNTIVDANANFSGSGLANEYTNHVAGWALANGMDIECHSANTFSDWDGTKDVSAEDDGFAAVRAAFDDEITFVEAVTKLEGITKAGTRQNSKTFWQGYTPTGFVWPTHINGDTVRTIAAEKFQWTRGSAGGPLTGSLDLYLGRHGYVSSGTGAAEYLVPAANIWRQCIPSTAAAELFPSQTIPADGSDVTGLEASVHAYLDEMALRNSFIMMTVHPGGDPGGDGYFETDPDCAPGGLFGRNGAIGDGRVDLSATQLNGIFEAFVSWEVLNPGQLCVTSMRKLLANRDFPIRGDVTEDVSQLWAANLKGGGRIYDHTAQRASAGTDNALADRDATWEARWWQTGVNVQKPIYFDMTMATGAGNGTVQYPYPASALKKIFACKAILLGSEGAMPIATLNHSGVHYYSEDGIIITPVSASSSIFTAQSQSGDDWVSYNTFENITFDADGSSANQLIYLGSQAEVDSLEARFFWFKDCTFRGSGTLVKGFHSHGLRFDRCVFITNTAGEAMEFSSAANPHMDVRNCVFDGSATTGGGYMIDGSTTIPAAWYGTFTNNVFVIGGTAASVAFASSATPTSLTWHNNYLVTKKSASPTLLWRNAGTGTVWTSLSTADYIPGGAAAAWTGFDPLTTVNDTMRWGGDTTSGFGLYYGRRTASIGITDYPNPPMVSLSNAASNHIPGYARKSFWEIHDLIVTQGVVSACDPLDTATYISVSTPPISDPAGQAAMDLLHTEWKAWYDSQDPDTGDRGDIILKY